MLMQFSVSDYTHTREIPSECLLCTLSHMLAKIQMENNYIVELVFQPVRRKREEKKN